MRLEFIAPIQLMYTGFDLQNAVEEMIPFESTAVVFTAAKVYLVNPRQSHQDSRKFLWAQSLILLQLVCFP
jgi:hypothetical protein